MKTFVLFLCLFISLSSWSSDLSSVLVDYDHLHGAFFKNDMKMIKEGASKLKKSLFKLKQKDMEYAVKRLENLVGRDDIKKAHEDFNIVSQAILVLIDREGGVKNHSRYYCPMVKKYWIQNTTDSEKVMNPYASSSMPHCGSKITSSTES